MSTNRPQLQLEFEPGAAEPAVYSVSALTQGLCELVESRFSDLTVEGEISNWTRARSGHCYFTLKDEESQIRCVLWRSMAKYVFFQPEDGMQVRVKADASVYERRGDLQLVVRSMRLAGEGALRKAFEKLKQRLNSEGLFDKRHKQPLPSFPRTIGVVTSGAGAALHDVLSTLERRFPEVRVVLCSVRVQGMGAAEEVAAAIERFNHVASDPNAFDVPVPDVLIVGRGGGSVEDLWAFNEEVIARAIFDSRIPVVSAVGHETDFSISDYVADVRAATPSMAAELVVPDRREVRAYVDERCRSLHEAVRLHLNGYRQRLDRLTSSYGFRRPTDELRRLRERLDVMTDRLGRAAHQHLQHQEYRLDVVRGRLEALNPERPLRRGYARVERDGRSIARARDLNDDDRVVLCFLDGKRAARIDP